MVLKRFLTAALGALGLGALMSGTALADGEGVPAPDLFNNQTACSERVPGAMARYTPTVIPKGAMASDLDNAIGMGTDPLAFTPSDTNTPNIYDKLIYTIPTVNCGAGTDDGNADNGVENIPDANGLAQDVAVGYGAVVSKYNAVYSATGTKKALDDAQKALDNAIKNGSSASVITNLTNTRDEKSADHTKALATLNSVGAGPVYQAAIDEWLARDSVKAAVTKYNTAVGLANAARTEVDGLNYASSSVQTDSTVTFTSLHVDLTNSHAGDASLVNNDGSLNVTNLRNYTGIANSGVRDDDNFDDSTGALLVPMVDDPNSDDPDDMIPAVTNDLVNVGTIRTDVDNLNAVVKLLEETLQENTNDLLTPLLKEGLRRAELEQAHFQGELDGALASTVDLRTQTNRDSTQTACDPTQGQGIGDSCYLENPASISSTNSAYNTENNKRATAETELRAKALTRETKTGDVVEQIESPASFYQQAVDRRQYEKDVADNNVTKAGTSASAGLKKIAEDKKKALEAAQKAQTDYKALVDDPTNPVNALISELVKADGDDGAAVVNAVSANHDAAAEAKTAADAAKAKADEVADSVAGLTGDDGSVGANTASIATNAADIKENRDDIDQLNSDIYGTTASAHDGDAACSAGGLLNAANCNKAAIAHNAGDIADNADAIDDLGGMVDDNEDAIATNAGNISMNAENIATNAGNIMTNAEGIATNAAGVMTNAGNIATNAEGIATNAAGVMTNAGNIATNAEGIATNAAGVMTNAGNIATNAEGIATNAGNIMTNAEGIATNAAGVMTNAGHIATNAAGIADNMAAIGANQGAIAANANSIGANASAIGRNASMIGELSEDLDVVRAGVAASMALAGMPAINGRGISIGVGSYDGESAFAVGFQIQGEQASFKVGVTSSGGETGASAGVGFNF